MLKFSVNPILQYRGVKSRVAYLQKLGMSYHAARYIVHEQMTSFNLQTIEKVCLALNCTPNDLLTYIPDGSGVPDTHALRALNNDRFRDEIAEGVQQLNAAELQVLKEQLRSLLEAKDKKEE